jgi:basic membrane protein A
MRKTKRFGALALIASLFVVAACGGDDDDAAATTQAPTTAAVTTAPSTEAPGTTSASTEAPGTSAEPGTTAAPSGDGAKVALLYDVTGRGDKSFNDAAYAGLTKAVGEFGVTPTESTPTGDADRADRLNLVVEDGNELVIGVGFLWADALTAGAQANPDTSFAIIDSVIDAPNVASLVFAENEGSFLVGVAAGLKTKSNKVGFIGGVENDLIKNFEVGFTAGVKAANPDADVAVQYISQPPDFSGFNDPTKGKEIAAAMYADGADVVYSAAGGSGLGAFEAAKDAGAPGDVWAIGVDSDQYNLVEPDLQPYILTSMLKRVDVAVYDTIKAYSEGDFKAGTQVFNLASDGVGYSKSGGFVDDISSQIDDYAKQIIDGTITVPSATS